MESWSEFLAVNREKIYALAEKILNAIQTGKRLSRATTRGFMTTFGTTTTKN